MSHASKLLDLPRLLSPIEEVTGGWRLPILQLVLGSRRTDSNWHAVAVVRVVGSLRLTIVPSRNSIGVSMIVI